MTQESLAQQIGVSQPFISQLENGAYNPSQKTLRRLEQALDADLKGIFDA